MKENKRHRNIILIILIPLLILITITTLQRRNDPKHNPILRGSWIPREENYDHSLYFSKYGDFRIEDGKKNKHDLNWEFKIDESKPNMKGIIKIMNKKSKTRNDKYEVFSENDKYYLKDINKDIIYQKIR